MRKFVCSLIAIDNRSQNFFTTDGTLRRGGGQVQEKTGRGRGPQCPGPGAPPGARGRGPRPRPRGRGRARPRRLVRFRGRCWRNGGFERAKSHEKRGMRRGRRGTTKRTRRHRAPPPLAPGPGATRGRGAAHPSHPSPPCFVLAPASAVVRFRRCGSICSFPLALPSPFAPVPPR